MDKSKKYILVGVIGILAFLFYVIMVGMRSDAGLSGPGAITVLVVGGAYFTIKSILKSDKDKDEKNKDE